jgi:hypothetical protein
VTPRDDIEREIDRLYAEPPEAFTAERDALAKRLKADGDAEGAARVRALRRPVRSAWAVNGLVHDDRAAVEGLMAAGERLRAAQRRALSGGGADELRERSEERRKLLHDLTQRAVERLGDDPPAAAVEEVAATLEAASIEEDAAATVLEGRLTKPIPRPAGFGEVAGLRPIPGAKETSPPLQSAAEGRAERRRQQSELRAAEERERKTRERVERIRVELEALQSRVAEKKDELRAAEADARGAAVDARRLRR